MCRPQRHSCYLVFPTVHHLLELVEPEPLVVALVGRLLQVLHVVGEHKVSQWQEVTVILKQNLG